MNELRFRVFCAFELRLNKKTSQPFEASEQLTYPWKGWFGQIEVSNVRELCQLQKENVQLKKVLAERTQEVEEMKALQVKKMKPACPAADSSYRLRPWDSRLPPPSFAKALLWSGLYLPTHSAWCPISSSLPRRRQVFSKVGISVARSFLANRGGQVNLKQIHRARHLMRLYSAC